MGYEKRSVGGAMNMDDVWEVVPEGNVLFSKNLYIRDGKRENIKGNVQVTDIDIPLSSSGVYRCIGAKEDPVSNTVVYFLHHTELDHRILQYHNKTNSIQTILQEQPGAPLNFNTGFLITGINIVYIETNNPLLFWTDNFNRPRSLNIEAAKLFSSGDFTGYYSSPFLENFIDAIKYPPLYPPTFGYTTDLSRITNNIKNIMWEFKYQFVFFNGEKSAWSPISNVTLAPEYSNLYLQPIPDDITNNVIEITGLQGASNVVKINIAARQSNIGDFEIIAQIDRDITTPTDATFLYQFYNDSVKLPIEINESIKLFDNVPQLAKAQDYIESNRIAYGNIVEGYDNVPIDVTLTPIYNERPNATVDGTRPACDFLGYNQIQNPSTPGNADENTQDGIVVQYYFNFSGYVPVIGDIVTIDFTYFYQLSKRNTLTGNTKMWVYPDFRAGGNQRQIFAQTMVKDTGGGTPETLDELLDRLVVYLQDTYGYLNFYYKEDPSSSLITNMFVDYKIRNQGSGDNDNTQGQRWFRRSASQIDMADSTHDPCQIGIVIDPTSTIEVADMAEDGKRNRSHITTPLFEDFTSFKAGAQHPFGIVYYDNANRSGGTNVSDGSIAVTKWYDETATAAGLGKIDIDWEVKHLPPDWAVKWSWVYAKNTTTTKFTQLAVTNSVTNGAILTSPNYPDAYLVSYQEIPNYISTILTANPALGDTGTNLSYQWTKGDRLRLIGTYTAGVFVRPTTYLDAEIIGTTEIEGINYLIVRQNISDSQLAVSYIVVEIYNTTILSNQKLYFEFGDQYPVLNPGESNRSHGGETQNQDPTQPSTVPATGTFTAGDVYFKQRIVTGTFSTGVIYVEDYNWLDYSSSANYNRGRPNRVLTGTQRRRKQAMIPFSGRFIENTNINDLNSFYETNFEEYEQKYGSIQKLAARDRSIICYQELKVGNIPVNERVIANQNAPILGQTDRVLNPIVYYKGEFGIGKNPESWARYGFADYFVDVQRGVICRLSNDGIELLSYLYKMNDEITNLFGLIAGQTQRINIYGVFNQRRRQYEITIEGSGPVPSQTLAFDEKNNFFVGYFDYIPEFMCGSNQDIVSFKNGRIWLHEANDLRNNFYGIQYNSDVWVVANANPSKQKVFLAISIESNSAWSVTEFTNNKGQLSSLDATDADLRDFELNEGIYYASLLYDTTTPNKPFPLINGDSMRDVLIVAKLRNVSAESVRLFAVNLNSADSERSNF